MNPSSPTPTSSTPPPAPETRSYRALSRRAQNIARVVGLLVAILLLGSGLGYYIAHVSKVQTKTQAPSQIKTLTPEEISQLSALGSNLGTSNQLLTIGATAQFNNNVIIGKDLSLTGKLNANGPVTLKSLTISGNTDSSITGLNVNGNLGVTGATTLQKGATIGQLLTVTGNLAVAGTANFGSIGATNIAVKNLSLTGPIIISHLSTQGPLPSSSSGAAIGGGGTSSISGNDTAGTVNINIGSGGGSGTLMSITFRSAYPSNVHVLLTPLSPAAASASVYVTRSASGFQINTAAPILPGSLLSFDYLVVQ